MNNSVSKDAVYAHVKQVVGFDDDDEFAEEVRDSLAPYDRWVVARIPLRQIHWHVMVPDLVARYAALSKETSPLPVLLPKDKSYETFDGNHRIAAAKARGETSIMAYVPAKTKRARKS